MLLSPFVTPEDLKACTAAVKTPATPAQDRVQPPSEWNDTTLAFPRNLGIHDLFSQQAQRTPEAIAIRWNGETLSYAELDRRSSAVARHLQDLGLGPDRLAGVYLERHPAMVVTLLAILKAGGAYVPLDPRYPQERLDFIVEDTGLDILVTSRALRERFQDFQGHLVCIDELPVEGDTVDDFTAPSFSPEQLSYLIYTSGSTGVPKGVCIEHHNVVSLLHWARGAFSDDELSGVLAATSICFDISVFEIFAPLAWGGCLILVENALALRTCADRGRVRLLNTVPSVMHTLLAADAVPETIATINLAGEPLQPSLVDALYALPHVRQVNDLYGPTETTVYSTWAVRKAHRPATIGRPLANTSIHLLDSRNDPVAIGVTGELWIGGEGVGRGYWRRPELTAERFVTLTISGASVRLYRTGDLARWNADGTIEYQGRADHQVKIRGHRIELGEIEMALDGHSEIESCAVLARDLGGEQALVAYTVLRSDTLKSLEPVRQWLKEKLPDYMVPSHFLSLPSIPLTANGKIDRRALAAMPAGEAMTSVEEATNETEAALVEIWKAALHRDRVGVSDDFYALGGHSLTAAVICSQISRQLQREAPLAWVLECSTIRALAERVAALAPQNLSTAITRRDRTAPLPASPSQSGLWLLQQTLPNPATYNEGLCFRFNGQVDVERLKRALATIQASHEILRTSIVNEDGRLIQKIAAAGELELNWREAVRRDVPAAEKDAERQCLLLEEIAQPFDLASAPLWRALWIELPEDEAVLALTFHHIVIDEWSMRLFAEELQTVYDEDRSSATPAGGVQFADYAAWTQERLQGPGLDAYRDYWAEQLRDLPPPLDLPTDLAPGAQRTGLGGVHHFQLSAPLSACLRDLARLESSTLFATMLAAFKVWLHRCTGQQDIVVASPLSQRTRPELQSLLGFFLNVLPIRSRIEGSDSFRQALAKVRTSLMGALNHGEIPIEEVLKQHSRERSADGNAPYRVMFVLLEDDVPALTLGGARGEVLPVDFRSAKSDLILYVQATGEGWRCWFEYAADLFSRAAIERLGSSLVEMLRSLVPGEEKSVSRLSLSREDEQRRVIYDWNRTSTPYPRHRSIQDLFSEQARLRPDAIALELGSETLSYAALDRRSDAIASGLANLGVQTGDIVGVAMGRSLDRIAALLGILKAGAAYWAPEEKLPPARLARLAADASPRLILADETTAADFSDRADVVLISALPEGQPLSPATGFSPERPAYVSYTSGSTGTPKGVVIPHRGVVRLVKDTTYARLDEHETYLQLSTLSFDASTFEIWAPLLNGGRLVLMPPGQPSLADIGDAIARHGVTTLWLTAGLFHLMIEERPEALRPLRQLLAGGDVLSPRHVAKARRLLPGCAIINGYGPTENTTFTCCHTIIEDHATSIPIGRPISNTQVYVLDDAMQAVPIGIAGELYTGGDGVACGYLNQPALTAERFVADPFATAPGAKLYRTGDRVRWLADGSIEFLERIDCQVKIRGFRVELGAIETALISLPSIREAIVIADGERSETKRLAAYVVAADGATIDPASLREALKAQLPGYMVPDFYLVLEALPLTPNGKVDRRALPRPEALAASTAASAATRLELELTSIWERVLQCPAVGPEDDFFALGGHSMLAMKLVAEIEKSLGCKLPIAALFQTPTISSLARRMEKEDWRPRWTSLVPLRIAEGGRPPLFLVHGVFGDVYGLVDLCRLLDSDQPVYGVQAVGLDGKAPRHTSVEEMAAHYTREIRDLQPKGPYFLGGFSLGGVLAFEVARQLFAQGEEVDLLALFDSIPVGTIPWWVFALTMRKYFSARATHHLSRWWRMPWKDKFGYFTERLDAMGFWIRSNSPSGTGSVTVEASPGSEAPEYPGFVDYYHSIAAPYRAKRYDGSIDIFANDQMPLRWKASWRHLAKGGVCFHSAPGEHNDFLHGESARIVAASLNEVLKRRQAGG